MNNCLVAQSGGPTSVINSSAIGIFEKNLQCKYYDNVYAGLNGIEGILNKNLLNLSEMPKEIVSGLKYTPSSGLGSCRYKLKDYENHKDEYVKLFEILKEYEINTFFYIGGNDSMDTVHKLSNYAKEHNINIKFIGVPKTIDNDLPIMDHTPGFGSAAKFIATIALENSLDANVYNAKNVFIIETMGRDTGWLAASACTATINGKSIVDFIYLPEVPFNMEKFVKDVNGKLEEKNTVVIVVSEGIRTADGSFLGEMSSTGLDKFGHAQLGGVCNYLKNLLKENGVKKVRAVELSTMQRSAMHFASETDIQEAYDIGAYALEYSKEGESGNMVAIKRISNTPYKSEPFVLHTSEVANKIKYFPKEWVNEEGNNVTVEAYNYTLPLIFGEPKLKYENGLPKYYTIR
ncbi:MAG: 6-phosphofructokinase [Clostridium argentinense]|uniref:Pyrophosphate--fructose 6-phosphate 1-phosphotransferase n=1 Tax=Clostridium faecium TaxID=2762223 RepID=A0ABR8YRE6_9CLOT|nr:MULTISPECIES: 6-phosphofructokinase [Clostridium]MBD8046829.1 6-phosphofructokinase [Clostridium faecium]MBS5824013.1 6-phosphofructokinase [Clostridium argentinense]MDU1348665.1 6-phosphofructokinase [Clostridium argentinense]